MQTILLIHHGESQSDAGLPTSHPETIALTQSGIKQAECIAEYLRYHFSLDLIVTSSYQRTKQTAAPTKLFFPSIPEKEWPVQEFTYLSSMHGEDSTVDDRRPLVDAYWEMCNPGYFDGPGSESFEQFIERTRDVMIYLQHGEEYDTIAMFSHEQFICALLWLWQRNPVNLSRETMQEFRSFLNMNSLVNGAIVRVQFNSGDEPWRYEVITSHLEKLEPIVSELSIIDSGWKENDKAEPEPSNLNRSLHSLSKELYDRLYETLLVCEEFDSDMHLQIFIAKGELAVYHKWFTEHEYATKEKRIKSTIAYLIRQRLQGTRPALPHFLMALHSTLIEGDALRDELEDLCKEVEHELARLPRSHNAPSPLPAMQESEPSIIDSGWKENDKAELEPSNLNRSLHSHMKVVGHRGAAALAPENTFSGFDLALQIGVTAIETNIQQTKDGKLVLFHDGYLDRTTNGSGVLRETTWEQLQRLDAGSWFDNKYAGERVPLLLDFLEKYGKRTLLELDIRQAGIEYEVLNIVEQFGLLERVIFTSYDFSTICNIKRKNPRAQVGYLTADFTEENIQRVLKENIECFCPKADEVTKELVEYWHSLDLFVRAYGVKTPEIMRHAIQAGVDGMSINFPDLLLEELAHGQKGNDKAEPERSEDGSNLNRSRYSQENHHQIKVRLEILPEKWSIENTALANEIANDIFKHLDQTHTELYHTYSGEMGGGNEFWIWIVSNIDPLIGEAFTATVAEKVADLIEEIFKKIRRGKHGELEADVKVQSLPVGGELNVQGSFDKAVADLKNIAKHLEEVAPSPNIPVTTEREIIISIKVSRDHPMSGVNDSSLASDTSQKNERKKYALVVGINGSSRTYGLSELKYAESGATGIRHLLERKECDFTFCSSALIGKSVSAHDVREAINFLIDGKGENDLLLFYFAGYGYPIEIGGKSKVYLVTSDFDPYHARLDPNMYLSLDEIRRRLYEHQKTASIISILDCCDAGYILHPPSPKEQFVQSLKAFATNIQNAEELPTSPYRTWAVLASFSVEVDAYKYINAHGEGHPLMTGLILDALSGNAWDALDRNGDLTLYTLHTYLQLRMERLGSGKEYFITLGQFPSPLILAHHPSENPVLRSPEDYPKSPLKQPFDMDTSPATFDDLDLEQVRTFLQREWVQFQKDYRASFSEQDQMQALGLTQGEHPSYATLLCFGRNPSRQIAGAYTRCIYWDDTGDSDSLLNADSEEFRGNLLQQFRQASDFLRNHLGIRPDGSSERPEFPVRALDEALANALVHRGYVTERDRMVRTEGVLVEIFSDRIEITSPGGPPAELDGKSHPRNPQIMRIFYLSGYVEMVGVGLMRMRDLMQRAGLPDPDIRTDQQSFTVILYGFQRPPSQPSDHISHDEALARIEFVRRDLLELDVDALVDPVGTYLVDTGSIGGQLIDRIGSELYQELRNQEPLKLGEAFVTGGGLLAARYLIHTRTENSEGRRFTTESIVKGAIAALHKAESLGDVRTIGIPALGSGHAGQDPVEIAPEILLAVTSYLKQGSQLERVMFAFINEAPYQAYIDAYRSLGGRVNEKEVRNTYHMFIKTTPNPVTLGQRMHLCVELLPVQLSQDEDKGVIELPQGIAEVYCFVRANGLCILNTDVKSMPLNSRTGQLAPAHFELQAHLHGSRDYTIELFTTEPNTGRTLIFQQPGQVTVTKSKMREERLSILPALDIRVGTRPDFVLQVDSEQRSDECAPYELTYRLSSRLHDLQFQDRTVGQVVLHAEELNRMRTLLNQRLQLVGHLQPEDTRAQMHALGTYLFDRLFPSDSAAAFREVFWKAADQITTWLIIEAGETWIPWELVAPYRADDDAFLFFLGERYQLSRWIVGYGIPLYNEVPLGAISLIHYQDSVSEPTQQNEETQVWGQLLRAHSIAQSVLRFEETKDTGQDKEPVHELHLLHYIDQLVSQRDLVLRDHSALAASLEQETLQARLKLRLMRPVVTLSILLRARERTHLGFNANDGQLLLERVLPFLQAGASAVVGPWWPTSEEADQLFWPTFYRVLNQRVTLGEALWQARLTVKNALPHLSDWLAYTLFGDPCARPYRPELSEGYTTLECLNPEEPLCPGKIYYFRASIRRHPPIWHHERLIRTEGFPQRPRALFLAPGLQTGIPEPMDMTPRGRDMLEAIVELRPKEAGNYLLTVRLLDGRERLQSLQLSLTVGWGNS